MPKFISWAHELERFKDALANRNVESFFISSTENSREMRRTFTILGNVTKFLEWLEMKAAEEAASSAGGSIFFSVGGGGNYV
jgi:hypothetical protein